MSEYTVIFDNQKKEYVSNHDAPVLFGNETKARGYLSDQGWFEGPEAWSLERVKLMGESETARYRDALARGKYR